MSYTPVVRTVEVTEDDVSELKSLLERIEQEEFFHRQSKTTDTDRNREHLKRSLTHILNQIRPIYRTTKTKGKMKNAVIYHRADYDGLFCRETARHWLTQQDAGLTEFIGWDFGDPPITGIYDIVYVLDLPCDQPFGFKFDKGTVARGIADKHAHGYKLGGLECTHLTWIDHHKSSIESHPTDIPGYRLDGVAACRLAWQWFAAEGPLKHLTLGKADFVDRTVKEPLAIRLAGEYDIWDHRDTRALAFQFGLDTEIEAHEDMFEWLLTGPADTYVQQLVVQGKCALACYRRRDAEIMRSRSFLMQFEGLKLLCLNTARCSSTSFAERDKPGTGHDALCGFYWNGKSWTVSLYHAAHRTDFDLSAIAVKYGGGGHRGACGFQTTVPFPSLAIQQIRNGGVGVP